MEPRSTTNIGSSCISLVLHPEWAKTRCLMNKSVAWVTTSPSVVGCCALAWSCYSVHLAKGVAYRIPLG
jgi:hypothetical protein